MLEGGERARLALEARFQLGIVLHGLGQHLHGDDAVKPRVLGAIHLAHATGANGASDLVRAELLSDGYWHWGAGIIAAIGKSTPTTETRRHRETEASLCASGVGS